MKKIFVSIAVVSILAIIALNVNINIHKGTNNSLTLANAEALADGEYDWSPRWICDHMANTDCVENHITYYLLVHNRVASYH